MTNHSDTDPFETGLDGTDDHGADHVGHAETGAGGPDESGAEGPPTRRQWLVNPVALVVGVLYATLGAGVLVEEAWGDIDLTAIAGAGAVLSGLVVIFVLIRRSRSPLTAS